MNPKYEAAFMSSKHPLDVRQVNTNSVQASLGTWYLLLNLQSSLVRCLWARYESLPPQLLPPLWLITAANPSDSGAVHSDVRRRWEAGDQKVVQAMRAFASHAEKGRSAQAPALFTRGQALVMMSLECKR